MKWKKKTTYVGISTVTADAFFGESWSIETFTLR